MTEEKTCYNCGNKNCHIFYSTVKQDVEEHHETHEYWEFDCVNHDKWEEMKVEEILTDNTETLKNALERIKELEKENAELKDDNKVMADNYSKMEQKFYDQLTKAKAIIREYKIVVEGDHTTVCSVPEENRCINVLKLNEQAEQFLKECQNEGC